MVKRVLITGGAGFLGFHLAKRLALDSEYEIVLADNFSRGKNDQDLKDLLAQYPGQITALKVDLAQPEELQRLGTDYAQVYHFAATNGTRNFYEMPHTVLRNNVLSTINVLDWFVENRSPQGKIIFSSSSETYAGTATVAPNFPIPTPEDISLTVHDPQNPRWSYGGSKILGELFFINYARANQFRMSIVRFHNVYGPRMGYEHVVPEFLKRVHLQENPFKIFGGRETRAFCYVDDMVKAAQAVMESEKTDGEIINIGNPEEEITIQELAKRLFKVTNFYPELDIQAAPAGSVARRLPDISKLTKLTNFVPQISLQEGLERTWAWHQNNLNTLYAETRKSA